MTDFDVIGLSYYPYIHGSFSDFEDCLQRLSQKYHGEEVKCCRVCASIPQKQRKLFRGKRGAVCWISGKPCGAAGEPAAFDTAYPKPRHVADFLLGALYAL